MKKTVLIIFILCCFKKAVIAQDFPYGSVSAQEMEMKKYDKDPSAHAVVLYEFGKTRIGIATDENIRLMFEYHVKIKIFDDKGVDNGTVELEAYNYNEDPDSYETIGEIKGTTYYKDDNGVTQKAELDNTKIYPVREGKNTVIYKFTMPAIRSGCVIEYSYRMISPYFDNFLPWAFQGSIPRIYSEYEAHIPAYFHYNISKKGDFKLVKSTSAVEPKCLMINSGGGPEAEGADCSVFNYAMADVPALVEEDYMTAPKNFRAAINFQLTNYTNPYKIVEVKIAQQWEDVDKILRRELGFGDQLKKKSLFKDRIIPVVAGQSTDLGKAKAIYAYIQQLIKWDTFNGRHCEFGIAKAMEKHTGNDADINIALVTALKAAGLNADAVLIGTRDYGEINSLYPAFTDFNYIITRLDIADQTYLLDATDPLLSFGLLPFRCLNGKGRVFSLDKPSFFMDINPPQKKKSTLTLDFTLQDDGKLKGTLIRYSTGYDAFIKRTAIKKFNSTDEYVEDFNSKTPKVKVLKSEILNLDSLELPVIEKYELEINIVDKLNGNRLAFNPFFWNRVEVNPFTLAERSYPVDFGMASDERINLTIHLPAGYVVDSQPQTIAVSLPDNGGKFVTNYASGDNSFSFSDIIQLNNPVYDAGEYPFLKELYNKIIQSEKAEIILKKK